jgi:hydrophobe/amphiphile efflux-1 (HAE1) family protein
MFLSEISIRRPVFTVMVTVALMTLGILGARSIGVDLFPDVSFPVVTVVTTYPGAGPEEVEQLVTKPVEEQVSSVNGVDEVRSWSRDSVSTVLVQFKLGTDVKTAANDVRDRVAGIRGKLPRDIEDPVIQRVDPTAQPILTYAVASSRDAAETRRIAEDVVKPRLEAIDGVAAVTVSGGLEREVHVYADRARLEALGMSLASLSQALAADGFDVPAGRVSAGASELNVKTLGRYRSLDELRRVVVATLPSGAQVRLDEVARVEDGWKEVRVRTRLDGRDAVSLQIQKQGGTNTVAIADQVHRTVADLGRTLPPDVKLTKAVDQSTYIRQNVASVTEAIVFGGAMAILVIFLFMLDWRSTLISALALPTSVVTTFLAMWWLGFTFNMMSLMALSLAIGLLIDDAVVVRENIYRHMERGEDPITAARRGTAEIGLAVMATTFTIVAVFVPVAFMGGIVGQFFRQFGLTVTAAVLVSLFVSFTLDPMMSARVVKPVAPGHHQRLRQGRLSGPIARSFDALDARYRSLLAWALAHKKTVAVAAAVLFVGSLALTPLMGKEFMTPEDRGEFRVLLEMPAGTSFEEMDRVTARAEELVRGNPEVRALFVTVGPGEEANKANLRVYTTPKRERKVSQWQIQDDLRRRLAAVPALKATLADVSFMEGAGTELPITLYVRGDDYRQLQDTARAVLGVVKGVRGVKDADLSFRPGRPETNLRVDRPRAADLGVSVAAVGQTARLALEGEVVSKYRQGDRDWDVRLQLAPEDRARVATLADLVLPQTGRRLGAAGPAGKLVRLSDVADAQAGSGPATIERMNRQRQIIVSANLENRALGDAVADIQAGLAKLPKPAGTSFVFGGQTQRMQETFSNMGLALFVAVVFIYFVLASQFESFVHPFTIMAALPLALVGALLLLFLTGNPIGMPAMIGVILLMGLVTKNAILLVDLANELRARGKGMVEALLEAGPTRLRPILMTSAAMVLGMLPTAVTRAEGSEFRAPMAIAVIGGVVASTLLTLVVVPVVYTWTDRFTLKRKSAATYDPFREHARAAAGNEAEPARAHAARREEG